MSVGTEKSSSESRIGANERSRRPVKEIGKNGGSSTVELDAAGKKIGADAEAGERVFAGLHGFAKGLPFGLESGHLFRGPQMGLGEPIVLDAQVDGCEEKQEERPEEDGDGARHSTGTRKYDAAWCFCRTSGPEGVNRHSRTPSRALKSARRSSPSLTESQSMR